MELGCCLESFEQKEDGVVAHVVKTKDGKESEEAAKFAYIVGADGARGKSPFRFPFLLLKVVR